MSEGIETLLEKKKANGIMFGSNFILSEIFISEWTLSLNNPTKVPGGRKWWQVGLEFNVSVQPNKPEPSWTKSFTHLKDLSRFDEK